jgi:hypothetical protein
MSGVTLDGGVVVGGGGTLPLEVDDSNGVVATNVDKITFLGTGVTSVTNPGTGEVEVTIGDTAGTVIDYYASQPIFKPTSSSVTPVYGTDFSSTVNISNLDGGISLYGVTGSTMAFAGAEVSIPNNTGDFAVNALIRLTFPNYGSWAAGVYLKDSQGKCLLWGFEGTQLSVYRFRNYNTMTSFSAYGANGQMIYSPVWYRLRRTSSVFYYEVSLDGKNYDTISTDTSSYLTTTLTAYGIGIAPNSGTLRLSCYSLNGA